MYAIFATFQFGVGVRLLIQQGVNIECPWRFATLHPVLSGGGIVHTMSTTRQHKVPRPGRHTSKYQVTRHYRHSQEASGHGVGNHSGRYTSQSQATRRYTHFQEPGCLDAGLTVATTPKTAAGALPRAMTQRRYASVNLPDDQTLHTLRR